VLFNKDMYTENELANRIVSRHCFYTNISINSIKSIVAPITLWLEGPSCIVATVVNSKHFFS